MHSSPQVTEIASRVQQDQPLWTYGLKHVSFITPAVPSKMEHR
jgi:hypothetical protein